MTFTNGLILNDVNDFVSVAIYLRNKDIFRNDIVTDFTILQIWTLLVNGRVRIRAFPTQRFSKYKRQRRPSLGND
jgi:hypothetical protein